MKLTTKLSCLVILLLISVSFAIQSVSSRTDTYDCDNTYINSGHVLDNYYSDARAYIGYYDWKRTLIQCATPSPAPANSTGVTSLLHFYSYGGATLNICSWLINRSGTSMSASWQQYDGTYDWSTPGGDYSTPAFNCASVATGGGDRTIDVTNAISSWSTGTPNYGMLLTSTTPGAGQISMSTFYDTHYAPYIAVTYTPPKPNVYQSVPADAYVSSSSSVTFNCSADTNTNTNANITNISLYINSVLNQTTTFSGRKTSTSAQWTKSMSDNSYTWYCKACSEYDCNTTGTRSLSVDTTAPVVNIVNPSSAQNNTWFSTKNIDFFYTYTELNPSKCYWTNNSGATNNSLSPCGTNVTGQTWPEGSTTVTVWMNDSGNRWGSASRTVRVDSVAPSISITTVNGTNTTDTQDDINYIASDTNRAYCWYSKNGGANSTPDASCSNLTTVTWSEGWNNIIVYVNDSAGSLASAKVSVRLDTTAPVTSAVANPYTFNTWTNNSVRFALSVTENGVGINVSAYPKYCNDSVNTCIPGTYVNQGTYVTITTEGTSYIRYYSNDTLGNNETYKSQTIKIDTIKPLVSIIYPTANLNLTSSTVILNFSASDGGSGLSTCWYTINAGSNNYISCTANNSMTIPQGASNTVVLYANDSAGNTNSSSVTFLVDTGNPTISLTGPSNNSYGSPTTQNFTGTIGDTVGVKNATIYVYNSTGLYNQTTISYISGVTSGTVGVVITLINGVYTWFYQVFDWVGNANTVGSNFTFTMDNITPQVNLTYPMNTTYITSPTSLNYTRSDTNLNNCWYNQGSSNSTPTSCNNFTGLSPAGQGSNTWIIYVNDSAGNINSSRVTFYVDSSIPTVDFQAPTETSGTYQSRTNIQINVTSSGTNYANVTIYLYNTTGLVNSSIVSNPTTNVFANYTNLPDGIYYFNATARDTYGQYNNSATRNVTIDTVNPLISYGSNSETAGANVSRTNIYINVSFTETNFANITFTLKNLTTQVNSTTYTTGTNSINWTNLPNTDYTYWVNITDKVNKQNSTAIQSIRLDNSNPSATLTSPTNNSYNSTNQNFTTSLSDNLGIKNSTLFIYNSTGLVNQTTTSYGSSITSATLGVVVTLVDGIYKWFYNVFDWAGNSNTSSNYTLTIDQTKPTVIFISPTPNNNTYQSSTTLIINFTGTETNLNAGWITFNGTNYTATCTGTSPYYCNKTLTSLSDKVYNYTAYINDSAGNQNNSVMNFITVDTTYPTISILTPSNNTNTTNTQIQVNYTSSDTNRGSCWWTNNSGATNTSLTTSCNNITGVTWPEGITNLIIYVNDSAGNTNSTSVRFRVDTTAPSISVDNLNGNVYRDQYNYQVAMNVSATDAGVGVSTYWYSLNGAANVTFPQNTTLTSVAGKNNVTVYVNDTLGTYSSLSMTYNLTFTPKINNINISNSTTSYSRNGFNSTGLIGYWKFDQNNTNQIDSSGNGNGTSTGIFNGSGAIGGAYTFNSGQSMTATIPTLVMPYTISFWYKATTALSGITDIIKLQGGGTYPKISTGTSGRLLIYAGQEKYRYTPNNALNTDTWYHVVALVGGNDTALLHFYINGVLNDGTAGGNTTTTVQPTTSLVVGGGARTDSFDELMIFNRTLSAAEISQLYQTTNPTFQEYANVTINSTITDEDTSSGSLYYSWFVDSISVSVGFANSILNRIFTLPNSIVRLTVNDSQNYSVTQYWNITTNYANPTINFTSPTPNNNTYQSSTTLTINFTGNEDNLNKGWVTLDGTNYTATCTGTSPYYCNKTFTGLSSAVHTYQAFVNDTYNVVNQTEIRQVTVDNIVPAVSIIYPLNTTYSVSVTQLNYTYSDTNLASCWYYTSMGATNSSPGSCTGTYNNPQLAQGTNTWIVYVNDSAGNLNSSSITFYEDSANPIINFVSPTETDQSNISRGNLVVNVTATDASLSNTTIYLYNSNRVLNRSNTTATSPNFQNYSLSDGVYYINATATDISNNIASTETRRVLLDTATPLISYSSDSEVNGANVSRTNIYLNVTYIETNFKNITFRANSYFTTFTDTPQSWYNFTSLPVGDYSYNVTMCDIVGQCNTTATQTIRLDTANPTILQNTPENGTYKSSTQNFTANITDDVGYKNATLFIYNSTGLVNQTTITPATTTVITGTIGLVVSLVDGIYTWFYNIFDFAGHSATTTNNTVTLDTIYPVITFTSAMPDGYYNPGSTPFVYVARSDTNKKNETFYLYNSTGGFVESNSYNSTFPLGWYYYSSVPDGVYYLNATLCDKADQCNSTATRTQTIDTTIPTLDIVSPSDADGSNVSRNNIVINFSSSDTNFKGIEAYLFNPDGSLNQSNITSSSNLFINYTSLIDGKYRIYADSYDLADNYNETNIYVTIDTATPLISYSSDSEVNGANVSRTNIYLNVTYTEANFKNLTFRVNSDFATFTDTSQTWYNFTEPVGDYSYNVTVCDIVGHCNTTTTQTIRLDTGNPTIIQNTPENGTYKSSTQNFTANITDDVGYKNATLFIYNSTGLVNQTTITPATTTVITGTIGVVVSLVDGIYTWFYNIFDFAGHSATTTNNTFTLDTTTPLISYNPSTKTNATWSQDGSVFINVSASDTNKDTVKIEFNVTNQSFDSSSGNNYWINKTGLATGTYTYYAWMNDSVSKFNATAKNTVYVDRENPSLTILNPTPGQSINNNVSIALNYSVSDTNLAYCWYSIYNGTSFEKANTTISSCLNTTFNITSGQKTLYLYANDSSGRLSSANQTFVVALTAPAVSFLSPSPSVWINYTSITFNFTVSDTSGLSACELWYSTSDLGVPPAAGGGVSWSLNQTKAITGTTNSSSFTISGAQVLYQWNIRCNNTLGTYSWADSSMPACDPASPTTPCYRSLYVDAEAPTMTFNAATTPNQNNQTSTTIYAKVDVSERNPANLVFNLYNQGGLYNRTTYTGTSITDVTWASLPDGIYTFNATLNDSYGATNSTPGYTVRVDTTGPIVTIYSPQSINYPNNNSVSVNFSASDNVTGVSYCNYWVNRGGTTIIPITEATGCQNFSIALPGGDYDYTLYMNAVDSLGTSKIPNPTVNFGIRTVAPAVVLSLPNDTEVKTTTANIFNFTATTNDAPGTCELWGNFTGSWARNQSIKPWAQSINTFSGIPLSEGNYIWNVLCNDTIGNAAWAQNNLTYVVDLTKPSINSFSVDAPAGSLAVVLNWDINETNSMGSCNYTIYRSNGALDGSPVVVPGTCSKIGSTSALVSAGSASYNMTFWYSDKAGNFNSTNISFTVQAATAVSGGGGGATTTTVNRTEIVAGLCGNRVCEPNYGETYLQCPTDCLGNTDILTPITNCFAISPETRESGCFLYQKTGLIWVFAFIAVTIVILLFFKSQKALSTRKINFVPTFSNTRRKR